VCTDSCHAPQVGSPTEPQSLLSLTGALGEAAPTSPRPHTLLNILSPYFIFTVSISFTSIPHPRGPCQHLPALLPTESGERRIDEASSYIWLHSKVLLYGNQSAAMQRLHRSDMAVCTTLQGGSRCGQNGRSLRALHYTHYPPPMMGMLWCATVHHLVQCWHITKLTAKLRLD